MEEYEQLHFRQDFTRSFGLRKELGTLYQTRRLDELQTAQLLKLGPCIIIFPEWYMLMVTEPRSFICTPFSMLPHLACGYLTLNDSFHAGNL